MQQSIAHTHHDGHNSTMQPKTEHEGANTEDAARLESSDKHVRGMEVDSLADSFAQMSHNSHKHPPRKPRGRGMRIAL